MSFSWSWLWRYCMRCALRRFNPGCSPAGQVTSPMLSLLGRVQASSFLKVGLLTLDSGTRYCRTFSAGWKARDTALRNRPGFRLSWSEQRAGGSRLLTGNLQAQGWQFAARRVWRSIKLPLPGTCFRPLMRFHHWLSRPATPTTIRTRDHRVTVFMNLRRQTALR